MLKLPTIRHTPPVHASSEWIAHNAAMQAKQTLLGKGERPRIGAFARWNQPVQPAIEIHRARRIPVGQKARDCLAVVGFVAVMSIIFSVGAFVGL